MYFLLMAEVYYGMFEEPSKILFFVGLPNQMRIQSDWSQKIILPLDMINWLHVRFLHQAYYLTGSFCIEVSREQIPIWVEVKTWNLRWSKIAFPLHRLIWNSVSDVASFKIHMFPSPFCHFWVDDFPFWIWIEELILSRNGLTLL